MKVKRLVAWSAGLVVVATVALYAEFVRETAQFSPTDLLACADVEWPVAAWTCKQVLLRRSFSRDEVAQLNSEGAAAYPIYVKNTELADEMLSLFISKGVDINAGDKNKLTALYSMVMEANPDRVRLLLRHGALVDVRDSAGRTPLDIAKQLAARHPTEPNREELVRLLEAAR